MTKRTSPRRRARGHSDRKPRETIDGETGKPDSTPRRIDLSTLRDVRLEMAAVYRKVDAGSLKSQDGSRRVYMLRQIADVIINTELEQRVAQLEQHAETHTLHRGANLLPTRALN